MARLLLINLLLLSQSFAATSLLGFAAVGDSILTNNGGANTTPDISANNRNTSYHNGAHPGTTTTQILSTFNAESIDRSPIFVIIEGGVNDLESVSVSTIVANWTEMLTRTQNAGMIPVMILIVPNNGNGGSSTQFCTDMDSVNTQLLALAPTYGAIVVDSRAALGQFRVGGPVGNLWNVQVAYYENDQIHLNTDGAAILAGLVHLNLPATSGRGASTHRGASTQR